MKITDKLFCTTVILIFLLQSRSAAAQDLDLNKYDKSTFSNLTAVTGQILGSGLYHTASVHRFGGIDVGLKIMIGFIPDENRSGPLEDSNIVPMRAFQASVGLFKHLEIGGRVLSFRFGDDHEENVNLASGMIKYNLLSGLAFPDVTVYSAYSRLTGITDFSLNAVTIGGIVGKSIPVLTMYVGVNYNRVTMDIDLDPDPKRYVDGFKGSITENVTHFSFGVSLGLAPFTKINAEYNIGMAHSLSFGILFSIF